MKVLFIKARHIILTVLILFFMLALIFKPDSYMQSVTNGLLIWLNSVLPALFPFFFFSGLLIKMRAVDKLGIMLSRPMTTLFHCPGSSGIIYLLSIISGYPVGAKITSEMYARGALTTAQVMRINAFASTSGPLFIVGSVGVGMFVDHTCGIIMLISHLLGALLNGILYRNYHYTKSEQTNKQFSSAKTEDILSSTMYDSIISILLVGGYIAIFFILIDVLFNIGLLTALSTILAQILSFLGLSADLATGITSGLFEITRGCFDLSKTGIDLKTIAPIACAIISWGGLCIHLQALTFLSKCGISKPIFFLQKFTQCTLSGFICWLLSTILM